MHVHLNITTRPVKNTAKIEAANPEHIGTVAGIRFFEHPFYGDEAPLIIKQHGEWRITDFYEVPDLLELVD